MLCDEPVASQETSYLDRLGKAVAWRYAFGQLALTYKLEGDVLGELRFAPQVPGALPDAVAAKLDEFVQAQVLSEGADPETHAPGLILLVDTPDGRYLQAASVASLEEGTPMQVDDRLEIGSNSKSFTVVLLLQLQEEGVLSLDDLLSAWPLDWAAKLPNGEQMSLRQLAQHTAGIWDYGDPIIGAAANDPAKLEQGYSPAELVQYAIDNGTPDFAPGAEGKWKYSNTGYILLGMILEKVTGQSLGELYKARIFAPLGLKTAALIEGVPAAGEITDGYWWTEDGKINTTTNWNVSQGWAAGGIAMTAEELLTYAKALAAGKLFKNPDTLAEMLTFDPNGMSGVLPYGLGLFDVSKAGVPGSWGHEGQTAGFQSLWYTNPETGVTDTISFTLPSGDYNVKEFAPAGWALQGIQCQHDPSSTVGVDYGEDRVYIELAPGDDVICTFENTKLATLTVVKNTQGGDGAFGFSSTTLSPTTFALTTTAGTAQRTFSDLTPGFNELSETVPAGWELTDLTCVGVTNDAWAWSGAQVRLELAPGDDATCTFTNTKLATLTVVKNTVGADGAFGFSSTTLSPTTFALTTTAGTAQRTFSDLTPGLTYDITETAKAGWQLTNAACSGGQQPDNITLAAGQNITCTFTNVNLGSIIVVKRAVGGDGIFNFASQTLRPSPFSLTTVSGTAQISFTNLLPGGYDVTEVVPAGWDLTSTTCSDGSSPASIALAPGENVTCTFTNTKRASLTVVKNTTGGDGAFAFTS